MAPRHRESDRRALRSSVRAVRNYLRFAVLIRLTVIEACPSTLPARACTTALPVPRGGAVNSPLAEIRPPPCAIDQWKAGCDDRLLPNWSRAVAANCCLAPFLRVTADGEIAIEVRIGSTAKATWLVTLN